jgi:hypothetical protein
MSGDGARARERVRDRGAVVEGAGRGFADARVQRDAAFYRRLFFARARASSRERECGTCATALWIGARGGR